MSAVVLATQATTKVFKSDGEDEFARQSFSLTVESGATLAFLPDPVTCFERAKYRQKQVFHLAPDANLVFVDWLTSGRKRNFVSTGAVRANRSEVHEHWDFSEYDNSAEIFVGGARLLTDRVRLAGMCVWQSLWCIRCAACDYCMQSVDLLALALGAWCCGRRRGCELAPAHVRDPRARTARGGR